MASSDKTYSTNRMEVVGKPGLGEADEAIRLNLFIQAAASVGIYALFVVIRPKISWLYSPNTKRSRTHPARGFTGRFDWIVPVFSIQDPVLLGLVGMDAFLFLQTLRLLSNIFFALSLVIAPLLAGYYFIFSKGSSMKGQIILKLSILSTETDKKEVSSILPCVACYVVTAFIMYMVYMFYRKYVILRQAYLRDASFSTPTPEIKRLARKLGSVESALEHITLPAKTVLLKGLPSFLNTRDDLMKFMDLLKLGRPVDGHIVVNTTHLDSLIEERKTVIRALEKEVQLFLIRLNEYSLSSNYFQSNFTNYDPELDLISNALVWAADHHPELAVVPEEEEETDPAVEEKKKQGSNLVQELTEKSFSSRFELCKPKIYDVDAVAFYLDKIIKLTGEIDKERSERVKEIGEKEEIPTETQIKSEGILHDQYDVANSTKFLSLTQLVRVGESYREFIKAFPLGTKTGFVTFEDKNTANLLKQSLIGTGTFSCSAIAAPPVEELIWTNLNETEATRFVRQFIGRIITVIFNIFFMTFVFLIVGALNVKSFEALISFINEDLLEITQTPRFRKTFSGVVAPLVYNLFLALAPIALEAICLFEGAISHTDLQKKFASKYSAFLFINGFLALIFGSSFLTIIQTKEQSKILSNIAELLSTSSIFFLNAIIQKSLVGTMLRLIEPLRIIAQLASDVLGGVKTKREEIRSKEPVRKNFGHLYPPAFLVFPVVLIYSIICPIFLFLGALYFLGTYVVFKTQFLYSLASQSESGGVHWPTACDSIFWSLLAFQVATALQFFTMKSYGCLIAILPLCVMTIGAGRSFKSLFRKRCEYLPMNRQEDEEADKFIQEALRVRKRDLAQWKEANLIEFDSVHLDQKLPQERSKREYLYKDSSFLPDTSTVILPEWFVITMAYLKENDKGHKLPL